MKKRYCLTVSVGQSRGWWAILYFVGTRNVRWSERGTGTG